MAAGWRIFIHGDSGSGLIGRCRPDLGLMERGTWKEARLPESGQIGNREATARRPIQASWSGTPCQRRAGTPDTILRRHRQLIAEKWDDTARRQNQPGRPPITAELRKLVLTLAKENLS